MERPEEVLGCRTAMPLTISVAGPSSIQDSRRRNMTMDGPKAEKHGDRAGETGRRDVAPEYASKERKGQRFDEYSTVGNGLAVFA